MKSKIRLSVGFHTCIIQCDNGYEYYRSVTGMWTDHEGDVVSNDKRSALDELYATARFLTDCYPNVLVTYDSKDKTYNCTPIEEELEQNILPDNVIDLNDYRNRRRA